MHFETELQLFWGVGEHLYYKISIETAFEATTVHRYFFFKNKNEIIL